MIERFQIIDHDSPRPDVDHIVFCDGTGGAIFRPETDLRIFRGTSTEWPMA